MRFLWTIVMLIVFSLPAIAEEQAIETTQRVVVSTADAGGGVAVNGGPGMMGDTFFISSEFGFDREVVKGAPYSAEATTEHVQVLADGNRITQKSAARVYRDSEGRTRREQDFALFTTGAGAKAQKSVIINDPVAKTQYILEPEEQVARKMPQPRVEITTKNGGKETPGGKPGKVDEDFEMFVPPPPPPAGPGGPERVMVYRNSVQREGKTESLGNKVIDGISTEGTRITTVIPAGQIGNQGPLEIVNEKWYSPDLHVNIMTTFSDPRFGTTVYRLTNINRAEPDASLFQVPAGYKVEDEPHPGKVVIRKEIRD